MSLPAATRLPQIARRRRLGRLTRLSGDEVNVLPQIRVISGVIPGCRENGEPGVHNHGPRVMDSEFAIFGGASGMTEPGFADAQHK